MSPSRFHGSTSNRLLQAMPETIVERLWPELQPVELARQQMLHAAHKPIRHLYFVERGLVSSVRTLQDGRMIEVGAVGIEGATGAMAAVLGADSALLDSIVHVPGSARRIGWESLRGAMRASPSLHGLLMRYAHLAIGQLAQAAACNRLHSLEQRLCRWLLVAHDSAASQSVPVTHEHLAMMLGVQRTGVSLAANILQRAGLIRCGRGHVDIVNRQGLEAMACECYATLRHDLDVLFAAPRRHLWRATK
jgi:CRP-like cAMP-binding protein